MPSNPTNQQTNQRSEFHTFCSLRSEYSLEDQGKNVC